MSDRLRIAFYAPLKPPSHPVPSGDRQIARLFLKAMRSARHDVRVISTFRSYEGKGDRATQQRLCDQGAALAQRLLRGKLARWRPDLWFTYHLYQKAPDWLGPPIARAFDIPYIVAEAAYAPRRSKGRWDEGLAAVADALRQADTAVMLNPNDAECVAPLLQRRHEALHLWKRMQRYFPAWQQRRRRLPAAAEPMLPFLSVKPYARAYRKRDSHRSAIAKRFAIPETAPWFLAVGMMRPGDKLASFRLLAKSLAGLRRRPWRLVVVGDGPARKEVRSAFSQIGGRIHWLGKRSASELAAIYAACDLMVWPAINEAIGMAILEAQAAGLPVVAGNVGALGTIVSHGETGYLVPEGDATAFRAAVAAFLDLPTEKRAALAQLALAKTETMHDIDEWAAGHLDEVLKTAFERAARRRLCERRGAP